MPAKKIAKSRSQKARELARRHPHWTVAEIAAEVGMSHPATSLALKRTSQRGRPPLKAVRKRAA
jgi:hypothetical protein